MHAHHRPDSSERTGDRSSPPVAASRDAAPQGATSALLALQRAAGGAAVSRALARSATPPVQRLSYTDEPRAWRGQPVTRSGEGAQGVFFVGPKGDQVVVKPMYSTGGAQHADMFLAEMGISTPRSLRYAKNGLSGRAIHNLLLSNAAAGRTPEEIPAQLEQANAFLVMDHVPGASLQQLGEEETVRYLSDRSALQQTGRMMVADAFLGNEDRVSGPAVNLGNFFYQAATVMTPGTIRAIDSDARFGPVSVSRGRSGKKMLNDAMQTKLGYLEMLLPPAVNSPLIHRFLGRIRQAHRRSPRVIELLDDKAFTDTVRAAVADGAEKAWTDMARLLSSHTDLLRNVGFAYDEGSRDQLKVSSVKATSKYVENRLAGVGREAAEQKLVAYVEQRSRRDRLPSGLKWVSKLARPA